MNTLIKYIFSGTLFCGAFLATAQEPIDAMQYRLQKRPKRPALESESFFDHTFFSAAAGVTGVMNPGGINPDQLGPVAGFYLGKWFTASSGLRLGVDGSALRLTGSGVRHKAAIAGLSADYLFNINAFMSDYDPDRKFEFIGVAGLAYRGSYALNQGYNNVLGARFGLQACWNISPLFDLYLEPRMGIFTDGLNHVEGWQSYDMKGDIMLGFNYNYVAKSRRKDVMSFDTKPFFENTFLSMGIGGEYLISGSLRNAEGLRNIGPTVYLSAGKWFTPASGLRLTGTAGYSEYRTSRYLPHIGGRIDYLLDLNSAFAGYKPRSPFRLIAIAGLNGDFAEKLDDRNFTFGIGAGVQANFSVSPNTDIYFEPRVNVYPTSFAGGITHNRTDVLGQLAFGIIYNQSPRSERVTDPFVRGAFANNLFVSAGAGGQALLSTRLYSGENVQSHISPRAFVSVGKWFTPVHGVRLTGSASLLTVNGEKLRARNKLIGGDIEYMFNITNAMAGYDEDRIFNISALAGAGLVYRHGKERDILPGISAGLHADFQLGSGWSLFLEPKLQGYHPRLSKHSLGFLKADPVASLSAGATYRIRHYDLNANRMAFAENDFGKYFFDIAAGPSMVATPFIFKQNWGTAVRATLGRNFTPVSAWRTHLRFESIPENRANSLEYAGVEADYQLDLTNLVGGYNGSRLFSLRAAFGFSMGASYSDLDLKFVSGIQASAQAAVRLNDMLSLYIEPQGHFYGNNFARVSASRRNDIIFSTLVGLNYRFRRDNGSVRDGDFDNSAFMNNTFASVGVGTGAFGTAAFGKNARVRPTWVNEIAFGKWLTPVSALRMAVSNSNASLGVKPDPHFNFNTLGLELGYITNWTALLTGSPANTFNLHSLLGISMVNGWFRGNHNIVPAGALGAQASFTLSKTWDIYLEPKVNVYSGKVDGLNSPVNVDMDAQLLVGTKYKF